MKASVLVVVLIGACGGGSSGDVDDAPPGDGGSADDDASNPPPRTPYACPVAHLGSEAQPGPFPEAQPGPQVCNPLAQTGCNAVQKCTWISDQDNPPIGHVGCAPDGTIAAGGSCTEPVAGPTGYDTCVKGSVCLSGTCKTICDLNGGAPMCGGGRTCTRYADFFETGGTTVAGVCDPGCNPLTQCRTGALPDACGSTNPAMPNLGCYGYESFSCAPTGMSSWTLTDRKPPRTNSSGNPYLNGCAPGFIPLFFTMTGSTQTLCTGLCAALETDNTPAHEHNGLGDPAAPAKLPLEAMAFTGDATCAADKKGSEASSRCVFLWPYLENDSTGELPPAFIATGLVDTLGVCMAIDHFMFDSNNDGTPDAPHPDCRTLPPRNATTTGINDDAADWGCQKRSNSARRAPTMRDAQIPSREAMRIERHVLE